MKWIDARKKLPDKDGRYFVIYEVKNKYRQYFIADWIVSEKRWTNVLADVEIIYWMEPPEMPQGE